MQRTAAFKFQPCPRHPHPGAIEAGLGFSDFVVDVIGVHARNGLALAHHIAFLNQQFL